MQIAPSKFNINSFLFSNFTFIQLRFFKFQIYSIQSSHPISLKNIFITWK